MKSQSFSDTPLFSCAESATISSPQTGGAAATDRRRRIGSGGLPNSVDGSYSAGRPQSFLSTPNTPQSRDSIATLNERAAPDPKPERPQLPPGSSASDTRATVERSPAAREMPETILLEDIYLYVDQFTPEQWRQYHLA
jgi:hypothetical protein